MKKIRLFANRYLSRETRRRMARMAVWPPVGRVRFGQLRRVKPISSDYGNSRGFEIDRYYIEKFLFKQEADIHGRVLEIKHNTYTKKFGRDRVTHSDVLHKIEGNADATIVADLAKADHIPSNIFDTIILTQTLQFIYDIRPAIQTLYRILKPGGVLLLTVPGISQIIREDFELWGEYWRFTCLSAQFLMEEIFSAGNVSVHSYGNVLTATAFLQGLACEDLLTAELDMVDPNYELLIAVRAVKPQQAE